MEFSRVEPVKPRSKSKVMCCVYGCNSNYKRCPQLAFHSFPRVKKMVNFENKFGYNEAVDVKKAWEIKLLMGKPVTKSMLVCSLHFTENDYFPMAGW